MRLALAQIDPTVGDLDGNRDLILARIEEARTAGADLVLLPELAVTGYPPEDLLLRPGFVRAARESLERIAAETRGLVALVGVPLLDGDLYNACAICVDGMVAGWARKWHLPNYGVFDEKRYFSPGGELAVVEVAGTKVGITICEDMWVPGPPTTELVAVGAELLVNLSASPFHVGRAQAREAIFSARPLRLDAVPLLLRGDAGRRTPAGRESRLRLSRAADRAGRRGIHRRPRGVVRRARVRSRGGEPAGTDPRDARDGALEQVRLAARRERQQVGALGRLRDAVRRHGGRLRAPQGRLQDGRLPARAAPERAGGS